MLGLCQCQVSASVMCTLAPVLYLSCLCQPCDLGFAGRCNEIALISYINLVSRTEIEI